MRIQSLLPSVLCFAAACRAASLSMDLPFDLMSGNYNTSYGDIFYNAPGYGAVPSPVTLHAGDDLHLDYHYLPGQALQIQHTVGGTQQVNFQFFQDFIQGVSGTFSFSFQGVQGQLNSNSYSGILDGQNMLLVLVNTQFTNSAFSFTGLDIDMHITGMRDAYYSTTPSPTFTTNNFEFQAYGDHVLLEAAAPSNVPDTGSTLGLVGVGLASLAWVKRRRARLVARRG